MRCKNCGSVPKTFKVNKYYVCYNCGYTGMMNIEDVNWELVLEDTSIGSNDGVKLIKRSLSENRNKSS